MKVARENGTMMVLTLTVDGETGARDRWAIERERRHPIPLDLGQC